ncbi:uncharacterized protein TNCV_3738491 [Trichonephila clavipes]|nr:uncharacterized protein TNCV_3738491 [Trichonephila clavipes]
MPRAPQAGFSRRSLAGVRFFESVRCHGPGLALLTNGGVQQQQHPIGGIPIAAISQSEVPRDYHNGAQRINPENRVGSSFRIIPEKYFSGIENMDDFLENIDHNLVYYEIPAQLACAYLKGHLKGRALDWFEVLGYRVIEDKTTDYAHLKQALSEQFPVVETSQN